MAGPDRDTIYEQAALWWTRRNAPGAEVRAAFAHWLAADPRHAEAFDAVERAWDAFDGALPEADTMDMEEPVVTPSSVSPRRASRFMARPMSRRWFGAGLMGAAAAAGAGIFFWQKGRTETYEFTTGIGERRRETLADGSSVDLDANSHLRVELNGWKRKLELVKGRVLFDVAKDADRPFVVTAATETVTALGTLFWVEVRNAETTVSLIRGRVRAETTGDSIELAPGDLVAFSGGRRLRLAHGVDASVTQAWRTGRLVFDNEPLGRVAERMNDYSADKITVGDAKAADIRISGSFLAGRTQAFTDALESYYGLSVSRSGQGLTVRSKGHSRA
jgi:transmembrane sensor